MKCTARGLLILAALGGSVSSGFGQFAKSSRDDPYPTVPGLQGPYGQPVPVMAPVMAPVKPPETSQRKTLRDWLGLRKKTPDHAVSKTQPASPSGIIQASASLPPGACPPGGCPGHPGGMAPPAGLIPPLVGPPSPGMMPPHGAVAAVGAITGPSPTRFPTRRTEVRFISPSGMRVAWFAPSENGVGFTPTQLECPARYNFVQAAVYRLKLSNIPNRPPGWELYPTLEVVPSNARTDPFIAHSAVPVAFTEEDFEQVAAGNYVVKVVYLPDPSFQDLATTGPDEVVSTRLEPGADPIAEAQRRGSALLVVRLGNIDLEAPNTPAMDAPSPYVPRMPVPPPPAGKATQALPPPTPTKLPPTPMHPDFAPGASYPPAPAGPRQPVQPSGASDVRSSPYGSARVSDLPQVQPAEYVKPVTKEADEPATREPKSWRLRRLFNRKPETTQN